MVSDKEWLEMARNGIRTEPEGRRETTPPVLPGARMRTGEEIRTCEKHGALPTRRREPEPRRTEEPGDSGRSAGRLAALLLAVILGLLFIAAYPKATTIILLAVIAVTIYGIAKFTTKKLEGDEIAGVTEEAEEVLKPEERNEPEILWSFAKWPIILAFFSFIAVYLVLLPLWGPTRAFIGASGPALAVGVIASIAVIKWMKIIPSDPPFVGVITLFGRITKWVAPAGYFLTIPYIRDVILIDARRVDQDFVVQNVFTRDNAAVAVKGHASYQADPKRLPMLIKSGKIEIGPDGKLIMKGVPLILDNMFPQYNRAEFKKMDLEESLGASEKLTAGISRHLTGERDFDLGDMSRNGKTDVRGLGIIMFVLNVTDIEPFGKTKEALELEVQEKYQRKGEVYEIGTRVKQALAEYFATRGIDVDVSDISEEGNKKLMSAIENAQRKDPKFDAKINERVTDFIEQESARKVPGSIIPGLSSRLKKGEAVPIDVLGALFTGLLKRPGESGSAETEKGKGKGKKTQEKEGGE